MSLSPMIILYSLITMAGIALVMYGVSRQPSRKDRPSDAHRRRFSEDISSPTQDVLALQFVEDDASSESPRPGVSSLNPRDPSLPECSKSKGIPRISASILEVFKYPLRIIRREKAPHYNGTFEEPFTTELVISPGTSKGAIGEKE